MDSHPSSFDGNLTRRAFLLGAGAGLAAGASLVGFASHRLGLVWRRLGQIAGKLARAPGAVASEGSQHVFARQILPEIDGRACISMDGEAVNRFIANVSLRVERVKWARPEPGCRTSRNRSAR